MHEPARDWGDATEQLRVLTCGAVDDGKSTLLGRLMVNAAVVPEDEIAAVVRASRGGFDYALLLDGLEAEREQGITIDVAYRYFSMGRRSFIIADAPGHEQFVRNMATAASVCDVAVLLADACKGLLPQTRRHAAIASLMGIRDIIFAVNKMDLVGYEERTFRRIADDFSAQAERLSLRVTAIPVSARLGENVVHPASAMPWYVGPTFRQLLENIVVAPPRAGKFRFPVQRVSRTDGQFRGYQGTIADGHIRRGDPIVTLPSGQPSRIGRIVTCDGDLDEAESGQAVTLVLSDEIEAGRGSVFAHPEAPPSCVEHMVARLVWLSDMKLELGRELMLRQATDFVPARIAAVRSRLDVVRLVEDPAATLGTNDIGLVTIVTDRPIVVDRYEDNRTLGAFVLVDRLSNATLAAGMVVEPIKPAANVYWQTFDVRQVDRPTAQRQA